MSASRSFCRECAPGPIASTLDSSVANATDKVDPSLNGVAVVGMACRVPGGNNDPEKLWQFLLDKKDASGEIPPLRWEPYYRRDTRNHGVLRQITSWGYFVPDLDNFDCRFFGISPKEAEQMDPQQRLALEVTWEALEDAGIPAKSLSGSNTAVFWGVNSNDYSTLLQEDLTNIDAFMGIGNAYCGVPNRLSYHLNLKGPSTAIDAACASSLVAIHHGMQSLMTGETEIAIIGGGNAIYAPHLTRSLQKAGALSPDGRCRSFDIEACGYGRGEGGVGIILKRLETALVDGDHVRAILKGTAVAQDGKTCGIMAPNAASQELVARKALDLGGIDPNTVQYIEAHATSTPLGDPTEISALSRIYGKHRMPDDPCFIGSLKPNIGHLEAGAGAMGFLKAVLALEKGIIPPQANLVTPHTRVDWPTSGLKIAQEPIPWPKSGGPRRAAVCSYGYGGTVSHAVIEKFNPSSRSGSLSLAKHQSPSNDSIILLISAPQKRQLAAQARSLRYWLHTHEGGQKDLKSIATTLAVRREHHIYRGAIVADSRESAVEALQAVEKNNSNYSWVAQSTVLGSEIRKDVVWVFSGHGAQWADMGKELVHNEIFLKTVKPLDAIVKAEIGVSPLNLLETGRFESSDEVQILTYIIQIGLNAVLNYRGVFPQAIIGHSVGEIAASAVAGAITLEEGTLIVTRRAMLYRELCGKGAMLLVHKPFLEMKEELAGRTDMVAAIDSSPSTCVISGLKDAIKEAAGALELRGVKVFLVRTDIAFHSPSLEPLVEPLMEDLENLEPAVPKTPLYSTTLLDPRAEAVRGPRYWADNMISPVRFTSAVQAAIEDGYRIFLEVSSHPLLSHSLCDILAHAGSEEAPIIPTLVRNKPSDKQLMYAIAQLHCCGADVKWTAQFPGPWASGVPTTTWIHQSVTCQIETGIVGNVLTHEPTEHSLIGQRVQVAGTDTIVFSTYLDDKNKPFPGSHPVMGTEIVPAACLINTFFQATKTNTICSLVLKSPLAIDAPRSVQVIIEGQSIKIMSQLIRRDNHPPDLDAGIWTTHTTAQWEREPAESSDPVPALVELDKVKTRIQTRLPSCFTIEYLNKVGVSAMGFPWVVHEHYGNTNEMIALVEGEGHIDADDEQLSWDSQSWVPILDAATSVGSTLFFDNPCLRMPAEIERVEIFSRSIAPKSTWLFVERGLDNETTVHVTICEATGTVLARITSMRFSEIEGTSRATGSIEGLVHQIAWPPAAPAEEPLPISRVVLLSNNISLCDAYTNTLPVKIDRIWVNSAAALATQISESPTNRLDESTAIVYIPDAVEKVTEIPVSVDKMTWEVLEIVKLLVKEGIISKLFVLTLRTGEAESPTALAHGSLVGLSRILFSEHPDQFGGMIDTEEAVFPLQVCRYIQGADMIRIRDGVGRTARLRCLPHYQLRHASMDHKPLVPRPNGTYVLTGGLGTLGLAVAEFLVDNDARRLVLISRRTIPPRKTWDALTLEDNGDTYYIIKRIQALEDRGATVYVLSLDITMDGAAEYVATAMEKLSLPKVLGVVHAAGVLEDQAVMQTTRDAFARVLAPKVRGGLLLHDLFPPGSVDFFVLFSSCGHLLGFPGQSSYGSSNAFLDQLATYRRRRGDNAIAFQWTAWHGMGMGASTDVITAELENRGITDITPEDAFRAWQHLSMYDVDHGVVLRSRVLEEDDPLAHRILTDITVRRTRAAATRSVQVPTAGEAGIPKSGPELATYLERKIREGIGHVLHLPAGEIDPRRPLSEYGVDSVMMTSVRRELQSTIKVSVPPTLTWSHPTVSHLVAWFGERVRK
ncbi:hypothetical protein FE257_004734 [Aspergillus nanangensis]|uniref:6-methylsalicylic acid synthase n=1 Tax=Aspergillus nanangensis TaxID=2582783 RepID=A0AAD4CR38_ASPNN|nr:hypothetical protein FE257_004734 [Aspergillus nanangensis]